MNKFRIAVALCAPLLALGLAAAAHGSEDPPAADPAPMLGGAHDFDFWIGAWKVHHRRLKLRLAGSHEWTDFDGTAITRPQLGGMANVDDSVFDLPGGAWRGVGVAAYDPRTAQWLTWGLDGRNPSARLDPPAKGRFENGIGTFYADDNFEGKPIRVRQVWTHATPQTAHFEQAFSPDGGNTWEVNWISDFQRVESAAALHPAAALPSPAPADPSGLHAFDERMGNWRVHHRRLKERLAGSHEWIEFDGTLSAYQTLDGWGNVGENVFNMPSGTYHGTTIRAYDGNTGQWSIWWLDGRDPAGALDPPMRGRFADGLGTFYADDSFGGKPIRVRFAWSKVTHDSAHWEQAYSADGGKTWEVNWVSDFRRVE